MAFHARLFSAFALLVLHVLERNAEAVKVSVDPKDLATPGALDRGCIDPAAFGRFNLQEAEAHGGGQNEGQRIGRTRRNAGNPQPGSAYGIELRQLEWIGVRIGGPFFPNLEVLNHEEERQHCGGNHAHTDGDFSPGWQIESAVRPGMGNATDVDTVEDYTADRKCGGRPLTSATVPHT